jgi:hypothetical protein
VAKAQPAKEGEREMNPENEYEREGAGPMPIQSAEAAGLEGIDEADPDVDPDVEEEVRLQGETEEAEDHEVAGPLEAALEEAEEEDAVEDADSEL